MMRFFRLLPGLALIGVTAFGLVRCVTEPSRTRLHAALDEARTLARREDGLFHQIAASIPQRENTGFPAELVWPGRDRAAVELAVQKALVEIASETGLHLVSFGSGPLEMDEDVSTVSYDVEVQGGHIEIARFLAGIEARQPALAISYLWLRPLPADPTQPIAPLNARMTVWAFREESGDAP